MFIAAAGAVLLYLINYFIWSYLFRQRRRRRRLTVETIRWCCCWANDDDASDIDETNVYSADDDGDEMQACLVAL